MTLAEFRTIIEKIGAHTNTLMFYFMGEPFLNSEAYQMIRTAKEAGIPWVTTCTNGDLVDPEQLVMSGVDEVSFQIGGMSQETHQVYRVNSDLERLLGNLKECLRLKRERRARLVIETGFILMKHNEHEVKAYIQYMSDLGVDRVSVVDPCVRTLEQGCEMLPKDKKHWFYDYSAFAQGVLSPRNKPRNNCPWIYYSMVILVNGDVVPCCRDATGKFVMGNLLIHSLDEIWNGDRFKKFRKKLFTDQSAISICNLCSSYPASRVN
jgi:radical SAM protein with 4Fe4S-binding SPASM domain